MVDTEKVSSILLYSRLNKCFENMEEISFNWGILGKLEEEVAVILDSGNWLSGRQTQHPSSGSMGEGSGKT